MGRQLFSKWNRVSSIWGLAWDVLVFPGRICCGGFTGNSGGPGTRPVPGLVPGPGSWARFRGLAHGPWPTGPGRRARSMGPAHGPWLPWDNDFQLWAQSPRLFWEIKIVVTTIFQKSKLVVTMSFINIAHCNYITKVCMPPSITRAHTTNTDATDIGSIVLANVGKR